MIVLDTNVLSELMKPRPSPAVLTWIATTEGELLTTTAITEAELRYGVAALPAGRRRTALSADIDGLLDEELGGRILAFDRPAAARYAEFAAALSRRGRRSGMADLMIAAIADVHGARIATRNVRHFAGLEVDVVDPFAGAG